MSTKSKFCAPVAHHPGCWPHCWASLFAPTENIVYNGFLLIIINTLFVFLFGLFTLIMFVFFPVVMILFALMGLIIWYMFGVHIYRVDKENHIINALFSVLIGVTPFLFIAIIYQVMPIFSVAIQTTLSIYAIIVMSAVSSIIMPVVVIVGSMADFMFERH